MVTFYYEAMANLKKFNSYKFTLFLSQCVWRSNFSSRDSFVEFLKNMHYIGNIIILKYKYIKQEV